MSVPAVGALRPFLLQGARGALFAAYVPPAPGTTPRGDVLYCPPFAEEMNRCRAMVSLQARALSEAGVGLAKPARTFVVYIDNKSNALSGYAVANTGTASVRRAARAMEEARNIGLS